MDSETATATTTNTNDDSITTNANDDSITIAVMGATGAGKSTFINLVSPIQFQVGEGLESCTAEVQSAVPFILDGKYVTLIDTPGFDDTVKTEAEILRLISTYLAKTYEAGRRLHGIVFLHRITDVRMGGVAKKNFRLFRKLCGDETLRSVVIATTMWQDVDQLKGEQRQHELATSELCFKCALDKGARMARHENTTESAHDIIRQLISADAVTLAIQREMVDERKAVPQTSAGLDLQAELEDEMNRHRKEMRELQQRMEELMMEKDNQHKEEIEELNEAVHEVRKQIRDVHAHSSKLNDERAAEKQKYEEEAQEMARVMQEREDRLRDLHEFSQTQKGMILELKEAMAEVQRKGEMQDHEKHMVEKNFKVAQEAHKSGLETLRKEFEEKLAGVMAGALPAATSRPRKTHLDVPPLTPISPRPRTTSQTRKPGFFSGLAVVLDQLFVPQDYIQYQRSYVDFIVPMYKI